jgi:hypothetical protein
MDNADLLDTARQLAGIYSRRRVTHALIGGLAVGLRSRPRATKDADFIVSIPALSLPIVLEDLVQDGFEIDVTAMVRRWPVDRFAVFQKGRIRVDWMQPILPLYTHVLDGAESDQWYGTDLRVATAEGLILTKLIAFRPQDQADIESLLEVNRDMIDVDWIRREWSEVAEGEDTRTNWLESALSRLIPASG